MRLHLSEPSRPSWFKIFLIAAALIYAALANLHTLQDFDLGWQLATGRWIVQHHAIFSADVFSYTAPGQPWIYPALSGIIFYLLYAAGGYSLLCWLGAAFSAATAALLMRRGGAITCTLALISVPLIASRTQPRAEMFTAILFAAFLHILWRHYRDLPAPVWLLPILMAVWVNLHPGFIAGLALCGAYLILEVATLLVSQPSLAARTRLQKASTWLGLTLLATTLNPWGMRIYHALWQQTRAQAFHNAWLVEWEGVHPSWASLHQALDWRDPQSAFWWLLAVVAITLIFAIGKRQYAAALFLAIASVLALQHIRFQALFACAVVIVGGNLWDDLLNSAARKPARQPAGNRFNPPTSRLSRPTLLLLAAAMAIFSAVRIFDLISDRFYLRSSQLSTFGTGISWWFPERALNFIEREHLPKNLFASYDLGGYLTWQLPKYPDYIDGRALPFGQQLFLNAYELGAASPDSSQWQNEISLYNINTLIVSLARFRGVTQFPQLSAFCHSQTWRSVYMDEVSVVFERVTPETKAQIHRLQIDCDRVSFSPLNETSRRFSLPADADRFNSWSNAASILYALGRYPEALAYADRAEQIFPGSAYIHRTRALVFEQTSQPTQAEAEFRTSLQLEPSDETLLDLGLFFMTQHRFPEAAGVFRSAAGSSSHPHNFYLLLGQADLELGQPQAALKDFDQAETSNPFQGAQKSLGASFNSVLATGRAKACYQLGDTPKAVSYQEEAVRLAPEDAKLWLGLADLYQAEGRISDAAQARNRAGK